MLLFLLLLCIGSIQCDDNSRVRIISGMFVRDVTGAELYTATAPFVYDIRFNHTQLHPIPLFTNSNNTCTLHKVDCQLFKTLNEYIQHIDSSLSQLEVSMNPIISTPRKGNRRTRFDTNGTVTPNFWFNNPTSAYQRGKRELPFNPFTWIGDFDSWCCGFVSKKEIEGLFSTQAQMNSFLRDIKSSVITDHNNIIRVKDSVELFSLNVSKVLHQSQDELHKVIQAHIKDQKTMNNEFELLNVFNTRLGVTQYRLLQQVNLLVELIQYQDVQSNCRAQTIPLTVVPVESLFDDLRSLQKQLVNEDHELVIPPSRVSEYYKLKIVDCTFTRNRILIRLRIPIKRLSDKWSLHEMVNVPFGFKGSLCFLQHAPTYIATSGADMVTIQGSQLHQCDPASGLCLIPQFNSDPMTGSLCPLKILQGASVSELNEVCTFECQGSRLQPAITQLDFHTFVITGGPPGMHIICRNATHTIGTPLHPTPDGVGAIEVQLTCNCEILLPGRRAIRPPYPCPSTLFQEPIHHILIPSIMSKIDIVLQSTKQPPSIITSFANLSACFNESWDIGSPKVNLSEIADLRKLIVPDVIHMLPSTTSVLMIVWNCLITLVLGFLLCKTMTGNGFRMASWFPLQYMVPRTEALSPDAIQKEVHLILTLIIILDLILLFLCGFIIYFCVIKRKLQQWRLRYVRSTNPVSPSYSSPPLNNSPEALDVAMTRGETRQFPCDTDRPHINITVHDPLQPTTFSP